MIFPTGIKCIDELLGGGIEAGTVTQIYGGPGTGKTNICLQTSIINARDGRKIVYIDTEGLSPERVKQMAGDDAERLMERVLLFEPLDFRQQMSAIRKLKKISGEVDLVIIDSFTGLYRSELEDEDKSIRLRRELTAQLTFLLGLARKNSMGILITNQVYTDINSGNEMPLGGVGIEHLSKVIIKLVKRNRSREAVLIKHRSREEGRRCIYRITERGVE